MSVVSSPDGGGKVRAERLSWLALVLIAVVSLVPTLPLRNAAYEQSRASAWDFLSDSKVSWERTSDLLLERGGSIRPLGQLGYLGEFSAATDDHFAVRRTAIAFHMAAAIAMACGMAAAMRSRQIGVLTGLLFAIHPVALPPVLFAEGRHLHVLALITAAGLYGVARWRDHGTSFGCFAACVAALAAPACHPVGAWVGPLLILVHQIEAPQVSGWRTAHYAILTSKLLAVGIAMVVMFSTLSGVSEYVPHLEADVSWAERLGAFGRSFVHLILPANFALHERVSDCGTVRDFIAVAVLAAIGVGSFAIRRSPATRNAGFGASWIVLSFIALLCPFPGFSDVRPLEAAWLGVPGLAILLSALMGNVGARVAPWLIGAIFLPLLFLSMDRARSFIPFRNAITESARLLPRSAVAQLDYAESIWSDPLHLHDAERSLESALSNARTAETEFDARLGLARLAGTRGQLEVIQRHVEQLESLVASAAIRLSRASIDSHSVLCDCARLLFAHGDTNRGRQVLERVLIAEPSHHEARIDLALLDARSGLDDLRAAPQKSERREELHEQINRAVVALRAVSGESGQSIRSSATPALRKQTARELNLRARTSLVELLLRTPWRLDALVEANIEADQLTRDFPRSADAWLARANVVATVDSKTEGEFIKRALECDPDSVNILGSYSSWLLSMGRNKEGLEQLELALSKEPTNAQVKLRLADFHIAVARKLLESGATDRLAKARIAIDRARSYAPDSVGVAVILGNWHEQQSEWNAASEAFARAFERNPQDIEARLGHARSLQREALGLLATPSSRGADAVARAGAVARAYELLREATRLAPDAEELEFARRRLAAYDREQKIEPLVDLSRRARAKKDLASAIEFVLQAEKIGPLLPDELALLGRCRAESGDIRGAIAEFERLKKVDAKSLQAANMLARLYARGGDISSARREAENFIRLVKGMPDEDGFLAAEIKAMELILRAPESR